ncbi:loganic acid O-methyltransferase-like [Carya illinoinensis]|uniref:loganic acid O-methyltransferase-like n=1 Tax=Carya illinoinensis TaxID=32201 RepID=UPI001C72277F|nr:loganic acid O-methyltransferase-like [Carya illinoinensis]
MGEYSIIAMNGGEGPNSYTHNSKQQRKGSYRAKVLLSNSIQEKLTVENKLNTANQQVFRIADLGCSVGPNTFASVQTIIEATELTFKTQILEYKPPEFHVFFNDHVPEEVTEENSSAWNKGRISYVGSSSEVVKAYTEQFVRRVSSEQGL